MSDITFIVMQEACVETVKVIDKILNPEQIEEEIAGRKPLSPSTKVIGTSLALVGAYGFAANLIRCVQELAKLPSGFFRARGDVSYIVAEAQRAALWHGTVAALSGLFTKYVYSRL